METEDIPSRSWYCFTIFPFLSCGSVSVTSIELTSIPKNAIFWHGSSTEFLLFIKKTRFWRRYISVPCKCQLLLRGSHQQNIVQKNNQSYIQFSQQRNENSHQLCEYPWGWSETEAEAKELIEQILLFET